MVRTRESLITSLGFTEVTSEVLKELESRTTKAAQAVADKINSLNGYKIYLSRDLDIFTVHSPFLVTREEISQIKLILKREYRKVGTIMEDNGLWSEWIKNK